MSSLCPAETTLSLRAELSVERNRRSLLDRVQYIAEGARYKPTHQ
jgi:hypothetical protein